MPSSRISALLPWLVVAGVLVAGFMAGFYLLAPAPEPRHTTLLPEPRTLPGFTLVDGHNQPWTNAALEGNWDVLFFGFTHCPDICPASLGKLGAALELLEERGQPLPDAVFVTVDPARDDPERVREYASWFHPQMQGVTGALEAIDTLAAASAIGVVRHPPDAGGDYQVDHTASLVLVNPDGNIAGYISPPLDHAQIAHDIEILMNDY